MSPFHIWEALATAVLLLLLLLCCKGADNAWRTNVAFSLAEQSKFYCISVWARKHFTLDKREREGRDMCLSKITLWEKRMPYRERHTERIIDILIIIDTRQQRWEMRREVKRLLFIIEKLQGVLKGILLSFWFRNQKEIETIYIVLIPK